MRDQKALHTALKGCEHFFRDEENRTALRLIHQVGENKPLPDTVVVGQLRAQLLNLYNNVDPKDHKPIYDALVALTEFKPMNYFGNEVFEDPLSLEDISVDNYIATSTGYLLNPAGARIYLEHCEKEPKERKLDPFTQLPPKPEDINRLKEFLKSQDAPAPTFRAPPRPAETRPFSPDSVKETFKKISNSQLSEDHETALAIFLSSIPGGEIPTDRAITSEQAMALRNILSSIMTGINDQTSTDQESLIDTAASSVLPTLDVIAALPDIQKGADALRKYPAVAGVQKIGDALNKILENPLQYTSENDDTVELIRKEINTLIQTNKDNRELCDTAKMILITLAQFKPINSTDPFSSSAIPPERRVVLTSGYQFDLNSLKKALSQRILENPFTREPWISDLLVAIAQQHPESFRSIANIRSSSNTPFLYYLSVLHTEQYVKLLENLNNLTDRYPVQRALTVKHSTGTSAIYCLAARKAVEYAKLLLIFFNRPILLEIVLNAKYYAAPNYQDKPMPQEALYYLFESSAPEVIKAIVMLKDRPELIQVIQKYKSKAAASIEQMLSECNKALTHELNTPASPEVLLKIQKNIQDQLALHHLKKQATTDSIFSFFQSKKYPLESVLKELDALISKLNNLNNDAFTTHKEYESVNQALDKIVKNKDAPILIKGIANKLQEIIKAKDALSPSKEDMKGFRTK